MAITDWQTSGSEPGITTSGGMLSISPEVTAVMTTTSQTYTTARTSADNNFFSFGPGLIGVIVPTELQIWPRGSKL